LLQDKHIDSIITSFKNLFADQPTTSILCTFRACFDIITESDSVERLFHILMVELALRAVVGESRDLLVDLIEKVTEKWPQEVFRSVETAFQSTLICDVRNGVLHLQMLYKFYDKKVMTATKFECLLCKSSALGRLAFLNECVLMLKDLVAMNIGSDADTTKRELIDVVMLDTIETWEEIMCTAVETQIVSGNTEHPVLVMMCQVWSQIWRLAPCEAPRWKDLVVAWAAQEVRVQDEEDHANDAELSQINLENPAHRDLEDEIQRLREDGDIQTMRKVERECSCAAKHLKLAYPWDHLSALFSSMRGLVPDQRDNTRRIGIVEIDGRKCTVDASIASLCPWTRHPLVLDSAGEVMSSLFAEATNSAWCTLVDRENVSPMSLHGCSIVLLEQISDKIEEADLSTIATNCWRCLGDPIEKDHTSVQEAAARLVLLQAHLFPSQIRTLMLGDLYSDHQSRRHLGLRRFSYLWEKRVELDIMYRSLPGYIMPPAKHAIIALPSIIGVAAWPLIDLCSDNSCSVILQAQFLVKRCLTEDPELFLRGVFDRMAQVNETTESSIVARLDRLHKAFPLSLPEPYSLMMTKCICVRLGAWRETNDSWSLGFGVLRFISLVLPLIYQCKSFSLTELSSADIQAQFLLDYLDFIPGGDAAPSHVVEAGNASHTHDIEDHLRSKTQSAGCFEAPLHHAANKAITGTSLDSLLDKNQFPKILTTFKFKQRPRAQAHDQCVQTMVANYQHEAKLSLLLTAIEKHPNDIKFFTQVLQMQGRTTLQDLLHDHYALRVDMHDRGIPYPAHCLIMALRKRAVPRVNSVLRQVPIQTEMLWLELCTKIMEYWDGECHLRGFNPISNLNPVSVMTLLTMLFFFRFRL